MSYAAQIRRLGRFLIVAGGLAVTACGSSGMDGLFDSSVPYRKVTRIERSGPAVGGAGPQLASLTYGERLRVPEMRVINVPQSRPGASARRLARGARLQSPVSGAIVTSYFGMREHPILGDQRLHEGIDLAAPSGTPIRAAADGTVDFAAWNGGYGRFVRLQHDDRYATAYAHMSRFADGIEPGASVRRGDVIGYVGSTGRSTGPHLHFELQDRGTAIDPLDILPLETVVALAADGE